MRRSEIKNGDVLYYDTSRHWQTSDTTGERVVVVDVEARYQSSRANWAQANPIQVSTDPKCQGVLVENPQGARMVAQPSGLRGPYDQVKAEVDARAKALDEEYPGIDGTEPGLRAYEDVCAELARVSAILYDYRSDPYAGRAALSARADALRWVLQLPESTE